MVEVSLIKPIRIDVQDKELFNPVYIFEDNVQFGRTLTWDTCAFDLANGIYHMSGDEQFPWTKDVGELISSDGSLEYVLSILINHMYANEMQQGISEFSKLINQGFLAQNLTKLNGKILDINLLPGYVFRDENDNKVTFEEFVKAWLS